MYHTTSVGTPTAHITKRKSRLKIYNGNKVFLNDGDNFEFEIYNPKQKPVLAKIKINGEYISHAGVVIKPGQRVFLERFLDSNNKFEFSTYEVKDTSENRSAIDLNGYVVVEFYDESDVSPIYTYGQYNQPFLNTYNYKGTTTNIGSIHTFTSSSNAGSFYSSDVNGFISSKPELETGRSFKKQTLSKSSIETGRVEKGDVSSQTFTNVQLNFNYYTCSIVSYKILPLSTKNKDVDEIRQYCTECGTKVKKNFKFCPSCGNKI